MRRLFVLEINEVPLRLLRRHAKQRPTSAAARLLERSVVGESIATDDLPRERYPSQSWASLATGVPFNSHGVFWYGDKKPDGLPLYWQAAADSGLSTGVVGTLHSSPLAKQCGQDGIVFAIPDAFAANADTLPSSLSQLQRFNLTMTQENSRAVTDTRPVGRYLGAVGGIARAGLSPATGLELARLAMGVGVGRVPKERLRSGQFHLWADQFTRLAKRFDPDLSVMFSNHLAAAMHRYWYTVFPEDWSDEIYPQDWVERFADEIPYALRSLDRWLDQWMSWCEQTNRTMLVISSMGQTGGSDVDTSESSAAVVRDARRFARALGLPESATVRQAMAPQVSYSLGSLDEAAAHAARINAIDARGIELHVDLQMDRLTVGYVVDLGTAEGQEDLKLDLGDALLTLDEAGLQLVAVEEHRAGTHHPLGSVVVFNSPTAVLPNEPFDYLQIAPAILSSLGVSPMKHHQHLAIAL